MKTRDGRLIRQLSSYTKPTFYLHSTASGPLPNALYTAKCAERAIVYYLYPLAVRWTMNVKIDSWGILVYQNL